MGIGEEGKGGRGEEGTNECVWCGGEDGKTADCVRKKKKDSNTGVLTPHVKSCTSCQSSQVNRACSTIQMVSNMHYEFSNSVLPDLFILFILHFNGY